MSYMMRVLVIVDDASPDPQGIDIHPGQSVTTTAKRQGLAHYTMGRNYDLVLIDERCGLDPQDRALYAETLMPWSAVLTLRQP